MKQINTMRVRLAAATVLLMAGFSASAQLNGTYTVYGPGANYATLQAAANALAAGVSGPVVFRVTAGTWSDPSSVLANIGAISGASATNTITFEAANGSAATTVLENTNTSSSDNNIFYLNGAKYVTVRNLTLAKTHGTYGTVVRVAGDADYNVIENCVLTGATGTSTSTNRARVYADGVSSANNNIIRKNTIVTGSYSIYWNGSSSGRSTDNEFSGNTLDNPYSHGVYAGYVRNVKINDNVLTHTGAGTFYGFRMNYSDGNFQMNRNKYTGTAITGSNYGISTDYLDVASTDRGVINENTIDITAGSNTVYGARLYYGRYFTFEKNIIKTTSTTTIYPLYCYNYYDANYTYNNSVYLNSNEITSTSTTTTNLYGHQNYSKDCQFNNNTINIETGSGTFNGYFSYYYQRNMKMNNNTIKVNGTSGIKYMYYMTQYAEGGYEFIGNNIEVISTTGGINQQLGYYSYYNTAPWKVNNNKIRFTTTSGYINSQISGYDYNNFSSINEVIGNDFEFVTTGSYAYNYINNYSYSANRIENNKFTVRASSTAYPLYNYLYSGSTQASTIKNNKIIGLSTAGTAYGIYNVGGMSLEMSNNSVFAKGTSLVYAVYLSNNNGGVNMYNNTVYSEATTSTHYSLFSYQSSGTQFTKMRNNTFSRIGGSATSYMMYMYGPAFADMDYNNYWKDNGADIIYFGINGQRYGSIGALRAGTGMDKNSLSYNPGFMNVATGDLRPDPASPASWALNGRGVQIAGNDKDVDNIARAVTTAQGVPDLGAYEFTPTSTPPDCQKVPALPNPNQTQTFLFGGDTVATIRWGNTVSNDIQMKQYTGTIAPNINSINLTHMFYHAALSGTGTGFGYELNLYYKDPWLGTIASKSALRLAEKVGAGNWTGYTPGVSVSNIVRNFIHTTGVNEINSLVTGIDVGNNASAEAIVDPVPPFCPGTYNVKVRVKNTGNNPLTSVKISYQINGGAVTTIPYNTTIAVNGTGTSDVTIPLTNVTFGSAAVRIKVWTHDPNGVLDPIAIDDTLDRDYFAALNGTYTVGGVTPNFPTVVDAVKALSEYGTCGSVIFNIRPGTYTGRMALKNPLRVSGTGGRVTFQSENGNASSVIITHTTPSSGDYSVISFNAASDFTIRKVSILPTGSANYGTCVALLGASNNDTVIGCIMSAPLSYYTQAACVLANYNMFSGNNLVIKDNKMTGGYNPVYFYGPTSVAAYLKNIVFDNNDVSGGYSGGMNLYYLGSRARVTNNRVYAPVLSSYSGLQVQYANESPVITGNRVSGYYGYGLNMYNIQGISATDRALVANNSILMDPKGSGTAPIYLSNSSVSNIDIVHNTSVYNGSSGGYGVYFYLYNSSNTYVYNNVFANLSGGQALYVYNGGSWSNFAMDYNNLYTTSKTSFGTGSYSATDLASWRSSSKMDSNSVSYDPAITSATDARPDVTNAAVWALNGHGLHLGVNNSDINGVARPVNRADGVPDIGAYEVLPDVLPPLATATPAVASPGVEQVFTFAGNEVGRITWGNKAPAVPVEFRQYSGEQASNLPTGVGTMWFHTDIRALSTGNVFDFKLNVDYMDIWLGTIGTENTLRLAHQVTGFPWMVYSGALSSSNDATNNMDAADMNRFGSFTGLENNSVPSAFVRSQGSSIICIGNNVVLNAEPATGDNYVWKRNGVNITGASGPAARQYVASQAGDYSVEITYNDPGGNKIVESVPMTISVIAPPNAVVNANKQLTYCAGNGLLLSAGSTPGLSYQWQVNGQDIAGATNATHLVGQAGNYTVVVTNIGCSTVSAITPVTSGPLTVSLGNDTSFCELPNVFMKLNAGYPGAKYTWNTGDTTQTIEVKQGGSYWVEVNGGTNCIDRDTVQVTLDKLPSANGISFVQTGNSYQFFAGGAQNTSGYLWLFGDGTTSNQATPTKVITGGHVYVRLVLFNACGTDTVQLGWPLSAGSVSSESTVQLYPNPAKDRVTISVSAGVLEEIEVLNSVGAVVYKGMVSGSVHSVDVNGLANGHYLLRATTDKGIITKQFDVLK